MIINYSELPLIFELFSICSMINKAKTNEYLNTKTEIDHDYFKKFLEEIQ